MLPGVHILGRDCGWECGEGGTEGGCSLEKVVKRRERAETGQADRLVRSRAEVQLRGSSLVCGGSHEALLFSVPGRTVGCVREEENAKVTGCPTFKALHSATWHSKEDKKLIVTSLTFAHVLNAHLSHAGCIKENLYTFEHSWSSL